MANYRKSYFAEAVFYLNQRSVNDRSNDIGTLARHASDNNPGNSRGYSAVTETIYRAVWREGEVHLFAGGMEIGVERQATPGECLSWLYRAGVEVDRVMIYPRASETGDKPYWNDVELTSHLVKLAPTKTMAVTRDVGWSSEHDIFNTLEEKYGLVALLEGDKMGLIEKIEERKRKEGIGMGSGSTTNSSANSGSVTVTRERKTIMTYGKNDESTLDVAKQAITEGGKLAAAGVANKRLCALARKHVGKHYPAFFDTELGHSLESLLVPMALHYSAVTLGDKMPQAHNVKMACELAMVSASHEGLTPLIDNLVPMFAEIADEMAEVGGIDNSKKGKKGKK
ncbi:MAG: hypothetical protein HN929_05955 [Chloroflexi bacterium]|nr:hypothetical protein [Chloroflexota bacterium]